MHWCSLAHFLSFVTIMLLIKIACKFPWLFCPVLSSNRFVKEFTIFVIGVWNASDSSVHDKGTLGEVGWQNGHSRKGGLWVAAYACQTHKAKTTAGVLSLVFSFTNVYPCVSCVSSWKSPSFGKLESGLLSRLWLLVVWLMTQRAARNTFWALLAVIRLICPDDSDWKFEAWPTRVGHVQEVARK